MSDVNEGLPFIHILSSIWTERICPLCLQSHNWISNDDGQNYCRTHEKEDDQKQKDWLARQYWMNETHIRSLQHHNTLCIWTELDTYMHQRKQFQIGWEAEEWKDPMMITVKENWKAGLLRTWRLMPRSRAWWRLACPEGLGRTQGQANFQEVWARHRAGGGGRKF